MKYYIGKNKKTATPISLFGLLKQEFGKNMNIQPGMFNDKSGAWINIDKRKGDHQISVVISLDPVDDEITDVSVYKTPYRLYEDETTKII